VTLKSIPILAGLCFLLLAACASLSEDTCRAGDWEQIGFQDGTRGLSPDQIFRHARACNDHGIAPNKTLWEKGRTEGLKLYCTPRVAYEEGADGDRLRPVCPLDERPPLLALNERGLTWYRLGRDIEDAERRISRINALAHDLEPDDPKRATLTGERLLLRLEISQLRAERRRYRY
jgi:hypothetical protein